MSRPERVVKIGKSKVGYNAAKQKEDDSDDENIATIDTGVFEDEKKDTNIVEVEMPLTKDDEKQAISAVDDD